MRDRDQPAMLDYLVAERAYYDQQTEPLGGLRHEAEILPFIVTEAS